MTHAATSATYSEEHLLLIDMTDFGVTLLDAMETGGAVGARFDADFEGEVIGDRFSGASVGTLYLFLTGGPSLMVRRYGEYVTEDHARIAVTAEGYGRFYAAETMVKFTESVSLYSAAPYYRSVVRPGMVGSGTVRLGEGRIEVTTSTSRGPVLQGVGKA